MQVCLDVILVKAVASVHMQVHGTWVLVFLLGKQTLAYVVSQAENPSDYTHRPSQSTFLSFRPWLGSPHSRLLPSAVPTQGNCI